VDDQHVEPPVQEPFREADVPPQPTSSSNKIPFPLLISLVVAGGVVVVLLVLILLTAFSNGKLAPAPAAAAPLVLNPDQPPDPQPDPDPDPDLKKDFDIMLSLDPNDTAEATYFADLAPQRREAWKSAAEHGSPYGQYLIGRYYYHENSADSDPAKAYGNFLRAAQQGLPAARFLLAECYHTGLGVPEELRNQAGREAATWYHLAALQGYARAQYRLGQCYADGEVVERRPESAAYWFDLAAKKGYAPAQYSLGKCYAEGYGVPPNRREAVRWYTRAANQGYEDALKALAELPPDPDEDQ
jgi:hypothetical protein